MKIRKMVGGLAIAVLAVLPNDVAAQCEGCDYTPFATCTETDTRYGYEPCYEVFFYCDGGEYCEQEVSQAITQDGALVGATWAVATVTAGAGEFTLSPYSARDEVVRRECNDAIVFRHFTRATAARLRLESAEIVF